MRLGFITNAYDPESHFALQALLAAGQEVAVLITPRQRRKHKAPMAAFMRVIENRGVGEAVCLAAGLLGRQLHFRLQKYLPWAFRQTVCAEEIARKNNILRLRPVRLEDPALIEQVAAAGCELLITCFCTQILPQALLAVPPQGTINLHRSLLPEFGGARPVFWALYEDGKATGVTIHRVVEKIDAGEVLAQETMAIAREDNEASLKRKLLTLGIPLLIKVITQIEKGEAFTPLTLDRRACYLPRPNRKQVAALANKLKARRKNPIW
jgi:folate-dependent phosphoribosylglycinamide formyltransferase PurN